MRYFPVFMDIKAQNVLVVGGGAVAERKVKLLLRAGARISVISRSLCPGLQTMVEDKVIAWAATEYDSNRIMGNRLVFAATSDGELNQRVYEDAENRCIPANVVDDAALCRFISPAVVDRSPVQIAICSGGSSPVLARRIRHWIERLLPLGIGTVARAAKSMRKEVRRRLPTDTVRSFWEELMTEPRIRRLSMQSFNSGAAAIGKALDSWEKHRRSTEIRGRVHLVGAGPGRPDLLSLRAVELLQQADVILHDSLVPIDILEWARRDAEFIDVGKRAAGRQTPQDRTNELMCDHARLGRTVVRLKGGDPFIFGRGGEELEFLHRHGIDFEVVPGITAASACAAYSGIPLTHRDHAQVVSFITGHRASGNSDDDAVDWSAIAGPGRTVAVYMGRRQAGDIRQQILKAGIPAETPVAVISSGTLSKQQTQIGELAALEQLTAGTDSDAPVLIIIGQVAALGSTLAWFESTWLPNLEKAA